MSQSQSLVMQETAGHADKATEDWMKIWEDADQAAIDRFFAMFTPNGVMHATPFSIARGQDSIRKYISMILTQYNGKAAPHEMVGVAGDMGIARWRIEYDVFPKSEWAARVLHELIESEEWSSYASIPFDPEGNHITQAGVVMWRFNDEGLVTEMREYWHTETSKVR